MGKKLLLNVKYKPDFIVIGVFCPLKDYRFCWLLNKYLDYNFNFFGNFPVRSSAGKMPAFHNVFECYNELLLLRMFVLNNKNNEQIIFPTPANLDYLLLIQVDESRHDMQQMIASIRSVPGINAAFFLDKELGKRADEIFYDLELFITDVDHSTNKK